MCREASDLLGGLLVLPLLRIEGMGLRWPWLLPWVPEGQGELASHHSGGSFIFFRPCMCLQVHVFAQNSL